MNQAASAGDRTVNAARWWLVGFVVTAVPFTVLGPGADLDSRLVYDVTIKPLLSSGRYEPSRFTGNPTHEFGSAAAYAIGGVTAANLATLGMAVAAALGFLRLGVDLKLRNLDLLLALLLFHPLFWCNSHCTIDYLWALGFFLWGFLCLRQRRWALAGVLLGLAVGARLATGVPIAAVALVLVLREPRRIGSVIGCALIALVVALALYLPALRYYDFEVHRFLTYDIGSWSLMGHVARWAIRNAYFWGIQALPVLAVMLWILVQRRREVFAPERREALQLACAVILSMQLLYLKIPLEMSYLLPVLPFALILLGLIAERSRRLLLVLLVAVFSYNFISVSLIRPDRPSHASSAAAELRPQYGYAINNTLSRLYSWGWLRVEPDFHFASRPPRHAEHNPEPFLAGS